MSEFTPGPWKAIEVSGPRDLTLKRTFWIIGQDKQATEGDKGTAFAFGDSAANAHLIAAAPDLYQACHMALNGYAVKATRDALRAALAKADGEKA